MPKLDEVKERVRDEVVKQKARELSQQKAAEIAAKLKAAPDFEKAAKAAGVEAKTTELIATGAPIPDLGVAPAVEEAAFKLPVGAVSDPIADRQRHRGDQGARKEGSDAGGVDDVEGPLPRGTARPTAATASSRAYMAKAKQKMKIDVNREALQRAASDSNHEDTKSRRYTEELILLRVFVPSCLRGPVAFSVRT